MTVELIMQVSRSRDNRLSGTVRLGDGAKHRGFSGALELMRVFEELVPADSATAEKRAGWSGGSLAMPESSQSHAINAGEE